MLFICIIILNIVIGIFQELKAKKLVDELSILNRPSVRIRRDGQDRKADLGELVRGDLMLLESGDQICSDAEIVEGSLEVNESLLTGESDAVVKEKGSGLLSGSFVISGKAYARVTHVGNENYAAKLAAEVKKEKRVHSELLGSMRKVTHFTSFLIVPLGILLFLEAFLLRQASVEEAVVSSAAGLLGMLPKGLVLLISVSLAAGVICLARMKILVQNIYSLETLAHVDTLCLDKTGTITDGKLQVCGIIPVQAFEGEKMDALIRSYMAASDDNNATFQALRQSFSPETVYEPVHKIPFSSKRKWGSVSFAGKGTIFVGGAGEADGRTFPQDRAGAGKGTESCCDRLVQRKLGECRRAAGGDPAALQCDSGGYDTKKRSKDAGILPYRGRGCKNHFRRSRKDCIHDRKAGGPAQMDGSCGYVRPGRESGL